MLEMYVVAKLNCCMVAMLNAVRIGVKLNKEWEFHIPCSDLCLYACMCQWGRGWIYLSDSDIQLNSVWIYIFWSSVTCITFGSSSFAQVYKDVWCMYVCVRMPLLLDYGYLKTSVFHIQAFAVIAASPLQIDLSCVLEHVIAELTAFLRKVWWFIYFLSC